MSGKWNPKEFHDTYHEDLLALIQKRIKSGKTDTIDESEPKAKKRPEGRVIDLMALLKKSVQSKVHGHSHKRRYQPTYHKKRKAA
jgi:DNA end-binding protein Ku